jgi:hypothetical protein
MESLTLPGASGIKFQDFPHFPGYVGTLNFELGPLIERK